MNTFSASPHKTTMLSSMEDLYHEWNILQEQGMSSDQAAVKIAKKENLLHEDFRLFLAFLKTKNKKDPEEITFSTAVIEEKIKNLRLYLFETMQSVMLESLIEQFRTQETVLLFDFDFTLTNRLKELLIELDGMLPFDIFRANTCAEMLNYFGWWDDFLPLFQKNNLPSQIQSEIHNASSSIITTGKYSTQFKKLGVANFNVLSGIIQSGKDKTFLVLHALDEAWKRYKKVPKDIIVFEDRDNYDLDIFGKYLFGKDYGEKVLLQVNAVQHGKRGPNNEIIYETVPGGPSIIDGYKYSPAEYGSDSYTLQKENDSAQYFIKTVKT